MKNDKIRIIHSTSTWLPQTETWLYNQVNNMLEYAGEYVVCDKTEHLDQFPFPNIHCLYTDSKIRYLWEKGIRKLVSRQYRGYLAEKARKINADLLHSHFGDTAWMNIEVARKAGLKHVVTFYGYDVNMLPLQDPRWLDRYAVLFAQSDMILCEGPYMVSEIVRLGCPPEKVRVHHLGVETGKIPYHPRRWQPGTPLKVLIAATFREKKGIPYALKALSELQKEIPLEVTLIGDATSEERSRREKQLVLGILDDYKMHSYVRMLGFQPFSFLFEEAYNHHIFLSPSVTASDGDTEGGAPVSIIEMMATGMPVVSTRHCDIPEVVQYGIDDWLAKERDVTGLIKQFQYLIENAGHWEIILNRGRGYIESDFNVVRQTRSLFDLYRFILRN